MSDTVTPKRRRLRACDSCRQRKIRCDNLPGSCRNCETYGIKCEISRGASKSSRSPASAGALQQPLINHQSKGRPATVSGAVVNSISSPFQHLTPTAVADVSPSSSRHSEVLQGVIATEVGISPKNSKFAGMTSAHVLAKTAEELFKARAPYVNVMDFLCPGMSFSEEFQIPVVRLSALISQETARTCIDAYKQCYGLLFPVLPFNQLDETFQKLYSGEDIEPANAGCVLLAIALGAQDQKTYTTHFRSVYDISTYLTARPYLPSVQALLLLTLCWMHIGKDGQAILTLASAIRIAQSIGLHRSLSTHHHPHEFNFVLKDHNLRSTLWWVAYCLDKKLSFEGGRPSAICDDNCDADLPQNLVRTNSTSGIQHGRFSFVFLNYFIGICQLLSTVSAKLFNIDTSSLTEEDLLVRIESADSSLLAWAKSLPEELYPDRELAGVQDDLVRLAGTLLHCIYFNTLLVIHRASLLGNRTSLPAASGNSPRIMASADICLMAARSLARSSNNLVTERRQGSVPQWTSQYPVNSVMALYVGVMRSPAKWSCAMDIALMKSLHHCFQHGEDKSAAGRFAQLLASLIRACDDATATADIVHNTKTHSNIEVVTNQQADNELAHLNQGLPPAQISDANGDSQSDWLPTANLPLQTDSQVNMGFDDNVNFGDLFGDYPSLWNMQLWPVSISDSLVLQGFDSAQSI